MNKYFDEKLEFALKIFISFFIPLIVSIFILRMLPMKYFYDSNNILEIINGTNLINYDGSYMFAGSLFRLINIFGFKTFNDWLFLLIPLCSIVFFNCIKDFKKIEIHKLLFLIATSSLLSIFVFRVSKDIIQFFFWFLILLSININNKKVGWIFISLLFLVEILYFRTYYIGIYFLSILIYKFFSKDKNNKNKLFSFRNILLVFLFATISLIALKKINFNLFYRLVNIRRLTNINRLDSVDAITIINDIFNSNNVILFEINLLVNFLRILLPFELIKLGPKYILFMIYQVYLAFNFLKLIKLIYKEKDSQNKLIVSMILSYLIVASLFEPDFGSVIRHEVALSPMYLTIILCNKN